ncbi:Threonine-phosphate decarboxylase [Porphyromonas levii]|nr:Threonine-phosphate decarboxylase [Porphyromonas levii]MBR8713200.1 Threonine-phosphate decarboxylase [Porphyromonas levii]MBR8715205.1 Threonine-phosphate decarboxylase [Porphyromonas levii]MBR8727731.1 Threonine-phosphate decarboxylase [Porphyromonas levii]MBR8729242.1 Threonine-phosphate decarboxylase [Porphyromonas levii]
MFTGNMHKKEKGQAEVSREVYDFGSISWKGADLTGLKEHLLTNIDLIEEYPEREAESIGRLLSRRLEVKEDQVIVTDGATGALHLIASVSRGATSLILPPTNQEFRHALSRAGHTIKEERGVKDLSKLDLEGIDYLWICNPNTPDGRLFSRRSILTLLREHPEVTVVVDLSMANYVVEDNIKASDIKKYPNLIVVGSFSRAFNVPGLRVGYAVAVAERISAFHENYTPRCVSTLALEATRFILLHPAQFTIPVRKWLRDSMELGEKLEQKCDVEVVYGATPFFIVRMNRGNAEELATFLWDEYSIKVGVKSSDLDLEPNEVRICGFVSARPNELLVEAMTEYFSRFADAEIEEKEA